MLDSGLVSPIREEGLPPMGSPTSNAKYEVELWKQKYRYASERKSLSPVPGAAIGNAGRWEVEPTSPGPGEYYETHENLKGQNGVGMTVPKAERFEKPTITPGPADYVTMQVGSPTHGPESPRKGAVFGTGAQRVAVKQTTPGPGAYGQTLTPQKRILGGTFPKTRREVSSGIVKQPLGSAYDLYPRAAPRGMATARSSSFGSSRRFEGPLSYTERGDAPGPGRYNVGTKVGSRGRSRTPTTPRRTATRSSSVPSSKVRTASNGMSGRRQARSPRQVNGSQTPGERAWVNFCARCKNEGLGEDELVMLSLDTLKALMKQVNLTNVVDAARIEVQWKQLRMARPEFA